MKKKVFDLKEIKYIGLLFLIALVIFKIAFFKEGFWSLTRNVVFLFWLFAIPGHFLMVYWKDKINFLERFFIGFLFSAAMIGIFSYYIGIIGLNIKYHFVLLPLLFIVVGIIFNLKRSS